MSRCYRIQVSQALKKHVQVDDGISTSLELLDILPPERMRELLAAQLAERGYSREGSTMTRALDEGVTVTVDLEEGSVHIGVTAESDLDLRLSRSSTATDGGVEEARARATREATRALEREAEVATEALRVEATRALEASLSGVRAELDRAVTGATAEALKEKARSMGDIQEIREDPETGAITIRVRV